MKIATDFVPAGRPDHATGGDTPWPPQSGGRVATICGRNGGVSEKALDDTVIGAAVAIDVQARPSATAAQHSRVMFSLGISVRLRGGTA